MIDPAHVTNFERTDAELQEFWLFCILVANKPAYRTARLLERFLERNPGDTPFEKVCRLDFHKLWVELEYLRTGQYTRICFAFWGSRNLDLRTASLEQLEDVYGVGPKTARYFLMHTRPDQQFAALDTHILKHLAENGHDVPRTTPPAGRRYREIESAFLSLAAAAGKSPADYDIEIWRSYALKEAA